MKSAYNFHSFCITTDYDRVFIGYVKNGKENGPYSLFWSEEYVSDNQEYDCLTEDEAIIWCKNQFKTLNVNGCRATNIKNCYMAMIKR